MKLQETQTRVLELINLNNHTSSIAKVIDVSDREFKKIITELLDKELVSNKGKNWMDKYSCNRYEITPKGEKVLKRELN